MRECRIMHPFPSTLEIDGLKVLISPKDQFKKNLKLQERGLVVNTINPHSFVIQKTDPEFRDSLKESEFLIPDGAGIVFALRVLFGIRTTRFTGFDLFQATLDAFKFDNITVGFIGSTDSVLSEIENKISNEFPYVRVNTYSPPFEDALSDTFIESCQAFIDSDGFDILFLGLTAPKQEKLISQLKLDGIKLTAGIGAVFDFYAGQVDRPSAFWRSLNLEWLVRLLKEPTRLWRRTFISAPKFMYYVFVMWVKIRFRKHRDCGIS